MPIHISSVRAHLHRYGRKGQLDNESRYTAVFNVVDKSQKITEKISQKELAEEAVELWSGRKLAELAGSKIDAHDCVVFRPPK